MKVEDVRTVLEKMKELELDLVNVLIRGREDDEQNILKYTTPPTAEVVGESLVLTWTFEAEAEDPETPVKPTIIACACEDIVLMEAE